MENFIFEVYLMLNEINDLKMRSKYFDFEIFQIL